MELPHQRITHLLIKWFCAAKPRGNQSKSRDQRQNLTWQWKGKKKYPVEISSTRMINPPSPRSTEILWNPSQNNFLFHQTWILSTGEFQKPLPDCIRQFGHVCFPLHLRRARWCCKTFYTFHMDQAKSMYMCPPTRADVILLEMSFYLIFFCLPVLH